MAEVWRAKDTQLDRELAIKVLPAGLAQDDQFLLRFEHICTLCDVGKRGSRLGSGTS